MTTATRMREAAASLTLAPVARYAADLITGLVDGDPVATWADATGNGRTLTQATSGNRPTWQTNEQNSLPVVRFDGSNDWLRCDAATWGGVLAQPNTLLLVAKTAPVSTDVLMDGPGGGAGRHLIYNGSGATLSFFAGAQVDAAQAFPLAMCLLTWTVNGASSVVRKNRAAYGSGDCGAQALGGLTLGADQGGASPLHGDVAELVIFDRLLTTAERTLWENLLQAKWGTP